MFSDGSKWRMRGGLGRQTGASSLSIERPKTDHVGAATQTAPAPGSPRQSSVRVLRRKTDMSNRGIGPGHKIDQNPIQRRLLASHVQNGKP